MNKYFPVICKIFYLNKYRIAHTYLYTYKIFKHTCKMSMCEKTKKKISNI